MQNILAQIYYYTFFYVVEFIDDIFYDNFDKSLSDFNFKIGFGSIEWFSFNFYELFSLIGSLTIGIIFILLVWKVFKFFTKLVNRAFGGRKW